MEPARAIAEAPVVRTRGLTKRYPLAWRRREVVALDRLDLEIRPGEVFGLLGPNGSGKSTTLKLLLGLVAPSSGSAEVFGEAPESLSARRRIGFLPENPYFYGFLSGNETLRFFGRLSGVSGALLEQRIEELIELVGLQNGRDRPLRSYSKGMLQRIGLAQALIHDPAMLFLDEPTAGVDPLGSSQIRDLLLRLKAMGKTIVFSSHLLEQVQQVADRVAIFALGRKILEGRLADLLAREDRTQIEIPGGLDPTQETELRAFFAARGFAPENVKLAQAHLTLEELYLRTVADTKPPTAAPP